MATSSRQLWLLRHAKATHDHPGSDFDRPLTEKGRLHAHRLGCWMRLHAQFPDMIVSSAARRALETTEIISREMNILPGQILVDEMLYQADAKSMLDQLKQLPSQSQQVLVVGHNPALEDLAIMLADQPLEGDNDKLMLPATLIQMQLDTDWRRLSAGCAHDAVITHGKFLS